MLEKEFSKKYLVKKITDSDIDDVFLLCKGNPLYYEYCPPMVTKEGIKEDMVALPPNMSIKDKYFVGYYCEEKLIAILDLISGYPNKDIAFVGLFMTDASIQNKGIGSSLINELCSVLKQQNYNTVRLAWCKGNPQSEHFWIKNGFKIIKETYSDSAKEKVIMAEKEL